MVTEEVAAEVAVVSDLVSLKKLISRPPVPPGDQPVGGRLQFFWRNWEALGVEKSVLRIVKEGYRILLQEPPPLTSKPWFIRQSGPESKRLALEDTIAELLRDGVIERVHNCDSPGFYNNFFLTPKPDGRWRPILDLKNVNQYVLKEHFKMETAETIRESLRIGEWVMSLDFTSAYHHVPVHPGSRKFLRFAVLGQVFQYKALPMGLTTSARIFTKVIKVVKEVVQQFALKLHQYFDD